MSNAFNIPAGYALVPLEPTMEMLRAGFENREGPTPYEAYRPSEVAAIFRDMLSAAPTPPVDAVPGEPVAEVVSIPNAEGSTTMPQWIGRHRLPAGTLLYAIAPAAAAEPSDDPELLALAQAAVEAMARRTPEEAIAGAVSWVMGPGGSEGTTATPDRERAASLVASEPVTVTVERMVESVNGVSWWVVLRRGKHRKDDGKYGADFKNRAEWHAAGLRWILGQGDKPNIRDFMDAEGSAGEAKC